MMCGIRASLSILAGKVDRAQGSQWGLFHGNIRCVWDGDFIALALLARLPQCLGRGV